MNPQSLALATFKHYWSEMASQYPVNNNDAALIFRAITDVLLSSKPALVNPEATLDDRVERVAAHFPEAIAPLCRDLAIACVEALQSPQFLTL